MTINEAIKLAEIISEMKQELTDEQALKAKILYAKWEDLCNSKTISVNAGYRFLYKERLFKTLEDNHKFNSEIIPDEHSEFYIEIK